MSLCRGFLRCLCDNRSCQLDNLSEAFRRELFLCEVFRKVAFRGSVCVHALFIHRDTDFLRCNLLYPKGSAYVVECRLIHRMVKCLVMLVRAVVKHSRDVSLYVRHRERELILCPVCVDNLRYVLVLEADCFVLPCRKLLECGVYRSVVLYIVQPVASLLPLVIEVKGRNRSAVECVLAAVELLRSVNVAETNEVKVCRLQRVRVNYRLKLAKECRLPALHIASGNGVV